MNKVAGFLLIFCLHVISTEAQVLLRGPYLQMGTGTTMNIRWRTDVNDIGRIRYGLSAGSLTNMVQNLSPTREHEIKITGLSPNTFYWYSIEGGSGVLQGDAENYFKTLPNIGEKQLYRIGVFGDCGSNNVNQLEVRNSMINYLNGNYMNAWILLGDNAYSIGTDAEYTSGFFNYYKDKFLKQNPLYPAPGNHDYDFPSGAQTSHANPYYSIFTMPTAGEAGGHPSGTEAFYSFDIGNIHFISLDSYGFGSDGKKIYELPNTQVDWLIQDLESNTNKDWVVVYFHHPPFTKGSHDSDNFTHLDADLVEIRTKLISILEDHGVDLVLCGHSHVYERTKLIKGYFGLSSQYNEAEYALSTSSARYDGTSNSCPYYKKASNGNKGSLYVVSGSAGQRGGAKSIVDYPHKAMYYSNNDTAGAMILEVEGNRLDAKWIAQNGTIDDHFTIMKEVNRNTTVNTTVGTPVTLHASYVGTYIWSDAQTTSAITVTPAAEGTTTYIVKDDKECLADTFSVIAANVLPLTWKSIKAWYDNSDESNKLQWETMNEVNVKSFEVERSENGRDFVGIGTVKAAGSTGNNQYDFTDGQLLLSVKKYYYKIRQEDIDGRFTYSSVVTVDGQANTGINMLVVPNPAKPGNISIKLSADRPTKAVFSIVDISGKTLMNRTLQLTQTVQSIAPNLQAAVYFVRIQSEGQLITKKLIVE